MASLPRRTAVVAAVVLGLAGLPVFSGSAHAAASIGTPTGLAPNSPTAEKKNPVLSWSDVSGANGYRVELAKGNDWSDDSNLVALPDKGDTLTNSYAVPQTLVHGVYYWRVRALSSSGNGHWSNDAQLDRAWTDNPGTGGSNPTVDATAPQSGISTYPWRFAWSPVPDASSYEVELSVYPTFAQPGHTQSGNPNDGTNTVECLTTNTSWTPYSTNSPETPDVGVDQCDLGSFDPGGSTVYWRVRAIDDSDTTQIAATSQQDAFECFGVPNVEINPPYPDSFLVTAIAMGTPASKGQECSDWSPTKTVPYPTTADVGDGVGAPGNVTGLTLDCGAGTTSDYACDSMPEVSWQPVANAAQYNVTIADDASFTNVERSYTTIFDSLTPRDVLPDYTAGNGYYVAVQACTDSNCGTASEASFTKKTPKLTNLAAARVSGGELLSWKDLAANYSTTPDGTPVTEAKDYQVEVTKSTDTDFDDPVLTTTVDAACDQALPAGCYDPPGTTTAGFDELAVSPATSGSYIWRVSPIDESDNVLPASTGGNAFTVDTTRPAFKITTKNGVSIKGPLSIKASEPVTGVNKHTVLVVPDGGSTSDAVAGKLTAGAGANSWIFRPKHPFVTGETYVLSIGSGVRDQANNEAIVTGNGVRVDRKAKDTSKAWTYSAGWTKHSASGARSGSYVSAPTGHTAKITVAGDEAKLYACKGPDLGRITVAVGSKSTRVNEHQSFTRCGIEVWHGALRKGEQQITVTVVKGTGSIDQMTVK